MVANPPEIKLTEFLVKSLVTAGVLLAIPAALSATVATVMLWITWPHHAWSYLGWFAFCGIGFFLLAWSIRVMRSPERVRRPRLVWLGVSSYLAVILYAGVTWLYSSFRLAQQGALGAWGWDRDELGPDFLVFPALGLLLPLWAFILSTSLCIRRECA